MKNNDLTKEEKADSNNLRNNTEAINVINILNSDHIKQVKSSEFCNSSKKLNIKGAIPVVPPKYSDNSVNVGGKKYIFKIDKNNSDNKNEATTFINKSKKMQKEKIYQEVSLSKRRKLVNFYNNNNCTLKKIADMLKINYSTAKSIMRRFRQEEKSQEDKKISDEINLISNNKHSKNIFLITKINKDTNEVLRDYKRFNKKNLYKASTAIDDNKNNLCKGNESRISYRNKTLRNHRKYYFKLIKNKRNIKASNNNPHIIYTSSSKNISNNKEIKCSSNYLINNTDKYYNNNLNLNQDNGLNTYKSINSDIDFKRKSILHENCNISRLLDNFNGGINKNINSFNKENKDNKLCSGIESVNHLPYNNIHLDKKENEEKNDLSKYSTGINLNDKYFNENERNDYNNNINNDNRGSFNKIISKTNINQLLDKNCYNNEKNSYFNNKFCNLYNKKPNNNFNIDKLCSIISANNNTTDQAFSNMNWELSLIEQKCIDKTKQETINNLNFKAINSKKSNINVFSNNINLNTNNATLQSLLKFVKSKQENFDLSNLNISTIYHPSITKQSNEALFSKLKNLLTLNDKSKTKANSIHTSTINQSNTVNNISNNNKNDDATNTTDYPSKVKSLLDKLLLNTVENSIINKYLEKTDANKIKNSLYKETTAVNSNIKNNINENILVTSDNMITAYFKHITSKNININKNNLFIKETAINQSNNKNNKEKDSYAISEDNILNGNIKK